MMPDVGCAGILVADTFCGPLKQLPLAGELLAIDQMPSKPGGCAANVAINLARQGFSVEVSGCVGTDDSAELLLRSLALAGVNCRQVQQLGTQPTSKTIILLIEGEDRRYIHLVGANAAFEVKQIDRDWINGLKVFYLGGLLAMPAIRIEELAELLAYCRQRKIVTVVDVVVANEPAGKDQLLPLLPHVDYFLPNHDEAQRLTGFADTEHQMETFLRNGVGSVVITCGENGAVAATGQQRWQLDVYHVDSIDPSGSGDAFAAGIVTGILRHWNLAQSLSYAAALGASATTAIGTTDGVFTTEQAEAFLKQNSPTIRCVKREVY